MSQVFANALNQATSFSLDVQEAMNEGKGLKEAFQKSIVRYPGWRLDDEDTLHFMDGSTATLTDSGLVVNDKAV